MITITSSRPAPGATVLQRHLSPAGTPQGAAAPDSAEPAPMGTFHYAPSALASRQPLPDALRAGLEGLCGVGLGDVTVHYNSPRPAAVQAHAYTQGSDIHLAPGQERYLPHEAWHAVQQRQGRVQRSGTVAGQPLNDEPGLEREADRMGARAAAIAQRAGATTDRAPSRLPAPEGSRLPGSATMAVPIQRVITYAKADKAERTTYTPEELLDNIRGTREAQRFLVTYDHDETALLDFLRGFDNTTIASREFLVNQIGNAAKKDPAVAQQRNELIEAEKQQDRLRAVSAIGWTPRQAGEVYFKLGLLRKYGGQAESVDRFEHMLGQVLLRARAGAIGLAGVQRTLATLTTVWPMAPASYESAYAIDNSKSQLAGIITTLMGLNGELDALYHASLRGKAPGETVFSGARFEDADAPGVEEDVDVSFIDDRSILHLIEVAGSLNALTNKLNEKNLETGAPDGQKQRYQYLSLHSRTLLQKPIDEFQGDQAQDQVVGGVQFAYSVPEHGFYPAAFSFAGLSALTALDNAGAGLNVGPRSYTQGQVAELRERIAAGLNAARTLEALDPQAMQARWAQLDRGTRTVVKGFVLNQRGDFPRVFHHLFHRQRRGVGTGLAGYSLR